MHALEMPAGPGAEATSEASASVRIEDGYANALLDLAYLLEVAAAAMAADYTCGSVRLGQLSAARFRDLNQYRPLQEVEEGVLASLIDLELIRDAIAGEEALAACFFVLRLAERLSRDLVERHIRPLSVHRAAREAA